MLTITGNFSIMSLSMCVCACVCVGGGGNEREVSWSAVECGKINSLIPTLSYHSLVNSKRSDGAFNFQRWLAWNSRGYGIVGRN